MEDSYGAIAHSFDDDDGSIRKVNVNLSKRTAYKACRTTNKRFGSNYVSTAKYTIFSFLPMSLFEQFRRVANFYFLMISILMLIGTYTTYYDTPYAPWSTLAVLMLVVMISVTKGGLEDLKRHEADDVTNKRLVEKLLPVHKMGTADGASDALPTVIDGGCEYRHIQWKDVCVGDILRVQNDMEIPADLVLLASSEETGTAYIETSNIDGEGNLKVKCCAKSGANGKGSRWQGTSELKRFVQLPTPPPPLHVVSIISHSNSLMLLCFYVYPNIAIMTPIAGDSAWSCV